MVGIQNKMFLCFASVRSFSFKSYHLFCKLTLEETSSVGLAKVTGSQVEQLSGRQGGGASFLCPQKYLAVQWWSPSVTWVWGMSLYVRAGSDTSGRWGAPRTPPGQTRTTVQNTWRRAPSPSHSLQTVFFAWAQSYWKCHWQVLSERKEKPKSLIRKEAQVVLWFFFWKHNRRKNTLIHEVGQVCVSHLLLSVGVLSQWAVTPAGQGTGSCLSCT